MSSTKRYMKFVKPYTGQIIGTLIIGLIKFAIPLLIPVIIQYVIDDIVTNQHLSVDEKTSKLLITMSIMLGVFVVLGYRRLNFTDSILLNGHQARFYMIFGIAYLRICRN